MNQEILNRLRKQVERIKTLLPPPEGIDGIFTDDPWDALLITLEDCVDKLISNGRNHKEIQ